MDYETSRKNINCSGTQSVAMEFKKEFGEFFRIFSDMTPEFGVSGEGWKYDMMLIIDGQCCEGDYIITTDEDDTHDFNALLEVLLQHTNEEWPDVVEMRKFYDILKPFLHKKMIAWG